MRVYKVDPKYPDEEVLRKVAEMVRKGKVVAYPTDTVYGLGTNALNERAVKRIFEIKGREKKPISIVVPSLEKANEFGDINETALKLMKAFFPGPITVVVKKKDVLPSILTAGSDKVGLRMPKHAVPLKLAEFSGVPITSTSANVSGRPSPTKAEDVLRELGDKIDVLIDAGETPLKVESTVVDTTTKPPKVLRLGALPIERIREVVEVEQ